MDLLDNLPGAWIEIQERGDRDRVVLMRPDADVPPTRGGRRRLEIDEQGRARNFEQGATDRMEPTTSGDWDLNDKTLELKLDGWEGEYVIESMTDTELILHRR